jgi:hypothetical protein
MVMIVVLYIIGVYLMPKPKPEFTVKPHVDSPLKPIYRYSLDAGSKSILTKLCIDCAKALEAMLPDHLDLYALYEIDDKPDHCHRCYAHNGVDSE